MATFANSMGNIGMASERATSGSEHALGTVMIANGTDYVYLVAAAAIAAAGLFAQSGTTTTSGTTSTHDVVAPGVLINQYFWAKKVATPF